MGGIDGRFSPMSWRRPSRIGDRRRWRDGVENAADIEACRGNWKEALVGLTAMFDAAKQDKDQRYMVTACRERAYCNLQLGDLDCCRRQPAMDQRRA